MSLALARSEEIEIRGLRKHYGSTRALEGLDLDLRPGEVLGIAGPNGAGKSTLIRILAGEERADAGELIAGGVAWSPLEAASAVAVVHQEPQLFPNLTVAENLMVGREGRRMLRPRLGKADRDLMEGLGIAGVARLPLGACTLATQQRTEIARALARDARVFLFDEPNSALTDEESDELFREMHRLAELGRIVMLVTHRLSDLVEHTKRVAVIRDGRVTAVLEGDALSEDAVAQQLVLGERREKEAEQPAGVAAGLSSGEVVFRAHGWTHDEGKFANIEMKVEQGEIIALVGVEGSGGRELLRSFAGLERSSGNVEVSGRTEKSRSDPHGLTAYVPATRQLSLYSNLSVGENLLVRLGRPEIAGIGLALRKRRMRQLAEAAVKRFLVKTRTTFQGIRSLSGGNQQKVAIAQALVRNPKLLLLEEPTRGVDIQSKREIYRLLREFVHAGNAVIMFCTEVLEMFEAADRVLVVSDGRLSHSLLVRDYTHVEALATDVTRLERHGRSVQ
ncbi:MAG: ribose transport system ATP-binding protein [Rhodospirillaceae bacterium]|jgi:ABC-type sugar transport system ATPase subunit|nr:ribose transport system ATP-binding protein [Rhodospirillaceae bacterium]